MGAEVIIHTKPVLNRVELTCGAVKVRASITYSLVFFYLYIESTDYWAYVPYHLHKARYPHDLASVTDQVVELLKNNDLEFYMRLKTNMHAYIGRYYRR